MEAKSLRVIPVFNVAQSWGAHSRISTSCLRTTPSYREAWGSYVVLLHVAVDGWSIHLLLVQGFMDVSALSSFALTHSRTSQGPFTSLHQNCKYCYLTYPQRQEENSFTDIKKIFWGLQKQAFHMKKCEMKLSSNRKSESANGKRHWRP